MFVTLSKLFYKVCINCFTLILIELYIYICLITFSLSIKKTVTENPDIKVGDEVICLDRTFGYYFRLVLTFLNQQLATQVLDLDLIFFETYLNLKI